MNKRLFLQMCFIMTVLSSVSQPHSIARQWNEMTLKAISNDFARPTIHARNLFHTAIAMYDGWAVYDTVASTYLLGKTAGGYTSAFTGIPEPANLEAARNTTISYAAYRLIRHRFQNSPRASATFSIMDSLFTALGYDSAFTSVNYSSGSAAALGNYIASEIIAYGMQDGANEAGGYANQYYAPVNPPLSPAQQGNPDLLDPNRWQPLSFDEFIDQSGNVFPAATPLFLGPEWGNVVPFALRDSQKTVYMRDSNTYHVYLDPGAPPLLDTLSQSGLTDEFLWTFTLVASWSSHLDPSDSVMWDISPTAIGNCVNYPADFTDYSNFYHLLDGGESCPGHVMNPHTGLPYAPQIVPRGDYARVLAEFWADGPDSETPPGHWFTILNYVNDQPLLRKCWEGKGPVLDELEWDVKAYFTLGGAMHDAAITAWSIKGWYDYVRPVSVIRYWAETGQSSDTSLANYSPNGIPLIAGFIEVVMPGDSLEGILQQNIGKIKLKAWKGPGYITDPDYDVAGVDWILAESWWPYQRPTFITPPFAGYISGHSTFSRTAAETLTLITGDAYFPGGMAEFLAPMNQFLVFERGPSTDVRLQWATYRDASDQCSLSRIWGGIHPPADDINGRLIGMILGPQAFHHADSFFDNLVPAVSAIAPSTPVLCSSDTGHAAFSLTITYNKNTMDTSVAPVIAFPDDNPLTDYFTFNYSESGWSDFMTYNAYYDVAFSPEAMENISVQIEGARDLRNKLQTDYAKSSVFRIDMIKPVVTHVAVSTDSITASNTGISAFFITTSYDKVMNTGSQPHLELIANEPLSGILNLNPDSSGWQDSHTYITAYDVSPLPIDLNGIDLEITLASDSACNMQAAYSASALFSIHLENISTDYAASNLSNKISLYPNPVSIGENVFIESTELIPETRIQIFNPLGVLIYKSKISAENIFSGKITLVTNGFAPGLYLIKADGGNRYYSGRVLLIE